MEGKKVRFTLGGKAYELTAAEVEDALRDKEPERTWDLAVWVNGRWYPPKQALVTRIGLTNRDVNSRYAIRQLEKLGFPVHDIKVDGPLPDEPGAGEPPATRGQGRLEALELAVQLLEGTGATADEAITRAEAFQDWLDAA